MKFRVESNSAETQQEGKTFHSKEAACKFTPIIATPGIHTRLKDHMHNLKWNRNSGINKSTNVKFPTVANCYLLTSSSLIISMITGR